MSAVSRRVRRTAGVLAAGLCVVLIAGCPRADATFTIRVVNDTTNAPVQAVYLSKGEDLGDPELVTANLLSGDVAIGEVVTITALVSLADSTGATSIAYAVPDVGDPTVDIFAQEAAGFERRDRYVLTVTDGQAGGHNVELELLPF